MLSRVNINNLWFMDDLKLFSKAKKEIDSLMVMVKMTSKYICMEFGIKKNVGEASRKEYLRRTRPAFQS